MDLHNNRRIGDYHPILLLLSALILIHKIIHIYILTPEVFRRLLIGVGELPFSPLLILFILSDFCILLSSSALR